MYFYKSFFTDSVMFKVLTFLLLVAFGMVDLSLPARLAREELTDPSQGKDLHEDEDYLSHHSVNKETDPPQSRITSRLNKKKSPISRTILHEAIEKQNQSVQVTSIADVISSKTDISKNSSPSNNQINRNNEKKTQEKNSVTNSEALYAFTAQLSSHTQVSQGSVVIFDDASVNQGEMYFNNSGYFVCPDNDVYMFVWTLRMTSTSSSRCLTSFTVGVEDIKYGPKTSYHSGYSSGTSQMAAVVRCRSSPLTGIAVVSGINPAPTYYGSGFSTFSGYRLASVESAVGFTVELSSDRPVFPGSRIMFNRVITNFGGMYDAEHGYFECPDSGIYSFTVTTHFPESDNQWSVSKLVFDGQTIIHGPITYWATEDTDSGSSSETCSSVPTK